MTPGGERRTRLTTAFCIGSDATGQLQTDDQKISRAYAAVFLREGQWWVRDLGGAGGITLNGASIQSVPLPPQAVLQVGEEWKVAHVSLPARGCRIRASGRRSA